MEKNILNEFLNKVVERTKNIKVGDPMNPDTQMGALISEEHLHKVLEYVDTAKKEVRKIKKQNKNKLGCLMYCLSTLPYFRQKYATSPTLFQAGHKTKNKAAPRRVSV